MLKVSDEEGIKGAEQERKRREINDQIRPLASSNLGKLVNAVVKYFNASLKRPKYQQNQNQGPKNSAEANFLSSYPSYTYPSKSVPTDWLFHLQLKNKEGLYSLDSQRRQSVGVRY
jgi:hypothetical protein